MESSLDTISLRPSWMRISAGHGLSRELMLSTMLATLGAFSAEPGDG